MLFSLMSFLVLSIKSLKYLIACIITFFWSFLLLPAIKKIIVYHYRNNIFYKSGTIQLSKRSRILTLMTNKKRIIKVIPFLYYLHLLAANYLIKSVWTDCQPVIVWLSQTSFKADFTTSYR